MVKKTLMGAAVSRLLKDLQPDIPPEQEHVVENEVAKKLEKTLGNNWANLPVTGPYMMVLVLILNYVLLPMGVTPVTVADTVISKSKEYNLDTKFDELLKSAKHTASSTGEFTAEKISELTEYSEEKGKQLGGVLRSVLGTSQQLGKSVLSTGKSVGKEVVNSIRGRFDGNEEEEIQD